MGAQRPERIVILNYPNKLHVRFQRYKTIEIGNSEFVVKLLPIPRLIFPKITFHQSSYSRKAFKERDKQAEGQLIYAETTDI